MLVGCFDLVLRIFLGRCRSYCEHAGMSYISGKCEAGYFCSERSITSTPNNATRFGGDVCVAGDYCPRGSPEAFACPGKCLKKKITLLLHITGT